MGKWRHLLIGCLLWTHVQLIVSSENTTTIETLVYGYNNLSLPSNSNASSYNHENEEPSDANKATSHHYSDSFIQCPKIELEPDEYQKISNNSVYIPAYKIFLNHSNFFLNQDVLMICFMEISDEPEETDSFNTSMSYLTLVCLLISIVCLSAHLFLFLCVADMRNLQGCNLSSLCLSLLVAYTCFLGIDNVHVDTFLCKGIAILMYYSFLASFFWSNIISFDVLKTLYCVKKLSITSTPSNKSFVIYLIYGWTAPLILSIAATIINFSTVTNEDFRPGFGEEICWFKNKKSLFVFFGIPIMSILAANFACFVWSLKMIMINTNEYSRRSSITKDFGMYLRLGLLMGFCWIFGIIATYTGLNIFWTLFVVFNTLQGLFIFVFFTCFNRTVKRRICKYFCHDVSHKLNHTNSLTSVETMKVNN